MKLLLIVVVPFAGYFLYSRIGQWKMNSIWSQVDQMIFKDSDKEILNQKFHPYSFLTDVEQKKLQRKILFFLHSKNINGVGEMVVTDEMKLLVAAEACLLIVNMENNVFPGLSNIYLLEDTFIQKDNPINSHTGLQMDVPKLGQAFKRGPIILSWQAVLDGLRNPHGQNNVVFHEFSHNLDQQDGTFDGTPPLGPKGNYQRWSDVMGAAFSKLRKAVESSHRSDIDAYGATNEAEFFAVVTEYYFNRPGKLQEKHPKIYEIFDQYFKLNPLRWEK